MIELGILLGGIGIFLFGLSFAVTLTVVIFELKKDNTCEINRRRKYIKSNWRCNVQNPI
jgi:hypothetical protein